MSRNYRILYLEDIDTGSIVSDLKGEGLQVETIDVDDVKAVNNALNDDSFQAYLMDYRLTGRAGFRNAPELAGRIRTQASEGDKSIVAPIILITAEKQLTLLKLLPEEQEMYDYVTTKTEFINNKVWSAELIKSLVEAYAIIQGNRDDLAKILGVNPEEKNALIDYRLEADYFKLKDDVYKSLQFLINYFVRSTGALVDDKMLAARLGVDINKSGDSWNALTEIFKKEGCLYMGIMYRAYHKWWMEKIKGWWKQAIPELTSFRYEKAETRIELLNKKTGLKLACATPIEEDMSHEFWTVCMASGKPLDPSDGYVCNMRFKREWEENNYISLKGALEKPGFQNYLSKIDRRIIVAYGEKDGGNK